MLTSRGGTKVYTLRYMYETFPNKMLKKLWAYCHNFGHGNLFNFAPRSSWHKTSIFNSWLLLICLFVIIMTRCSRLILFISSPNLETDNSLGNSIAQDNNLGARNIHLTWLNIVLWTCSEDRAKIEICGERGERKGGRVGVIEEGTKEGREGGREWGREGGRAEGEGREIL